MWGRAKSSNDAPLSDLLSPATLPTCPLTLIVHLAHHRLQAVLLPRLVNGSSIQSDGISLLGLLGTRGSVQHVGQCSLAPGPLSQELRDAHQSAPE